jgi:hypothetical protein
MWAAGVNIFQSKKRRWSDWKLSPFSASHSTFPVASVHEPSSSSTKELQTDLVFEHLNQQQVIELQNRLRRSGLLADNLPIGRSCVEFRPNMITEDDEISRRCLDQHVIELDNRLQRSGLLAYDSPMEKWCVDCRPNGSTTNTEDDDDDEISSLTSPTNRSC